MLGGGLLAFTINSFLNSCILQFKMHQALMLYQFEEAKANGKVHHFTKLNTVRDLKFPKSETWFILGIYIAFVFNYLLIPKGVMFADIIFVYSVVAICIVKEIKYKKEHELITLLTKKAPVIYTLVVQRDNALVLVLSLLTLVYMVGLIDNFNILATLWNQLIV